jgi:hypothetical protein
MSYGTKYQLSYTDNSSQAVIIDLKKDGYSGAVTALIGAGEPLVINHDNSSDFLFEPILGTWVSLRIIVKTVFGYGDLFTTDAREWQMIVSIAGATYFTGYIMPFLFNHDYKSEPYVLEIVASDQLGLLRKISYPDFIGGESKMPLEIIHAVLSFTGLSLDMKEGINVYEDSMTTGAAYSPLNQCYIPLESYEDEEGNPWDCYSVLKDILLRYGAVIRQVKNQWHIWRPSESTATYNRRYWVNRPEGGGYFYYTSTEAHDPTVVTTASGVSRATLVRTLTNGTLSMMEAWRDYTLVQKYNLRKSFLYNSGFMDWIDANNPYYWNKTANAEICRMKKGVCYFADWPTFGEYIYQTIDNIEDTSGQVIRFRLKFQSFVPDDESAVLSVQIRVTHETTIYYWDFTNNTWIAHPMITNLDVSCAEGVWEHDFELVSDDLAGITGELEIRIYALVNILSSNSWIYVNNCELQILKKVGTGTIEYDEDLTELVPINADNSLEGEEVSVLTDELPDVANISHIWGAGIFRDSALLTKTTHWHDSGSTEELTLIELLKSLIAKQYGASAEMISVNIMTKLLSGDDTIQLAQHSNKKYFPRRIEWSQKAGIMKYEMIEIICVTGFLLQETGDYILQETGDKIII